MIVVADTSPINYLILIEQISILHAIYGNILIPLAVHDELLDLARRPSLQHGNAPAFLVGEFSPVQPQRIPTTRS